MIIDCINPALVTIFGNQFLSCDAIYPQDNFQSMTVTALNGLSDTIQGNAVLDPETISIVVTGSLILFAMSYTAGVLLRLLNLR